MVLVGTLFSGLFSERVRLCSPEELLLATLNNNDVTGIAMTNQRSGVHRKTPVYLRRQMAGKVDTPMLNAGQMFEEKPSAQVYLVYSSADGFGKGFRGYIWRP